VPAVMALYAQVGPVLIPALAAVAGFIRGTLLPVFTAVAGFIVDKVVPVVGTVLTKALGGLKDMFGKVQGAVDRNRPALEKLFSVLSAVAGFIVDKAGNALGVILPEAFRIIGSVIGGAIDGLGSFVGLVESAVGWVQRLIDKLSNSKVGKALSGALGAITGSASVAVSATAARHVATHQVTAAAGSGALLMPSLVPTVNQDVRVFLGDRELTQVVVEVVDRAERRQARRIASGVRR
jgi:phage-related protein